MAAPAHIPFQNYCKELLAVFKKAKTNSDPALFLYKNKARTALFMAESILRVSNKLFEDKEIGEWRTTIKKLEDHLGEMDLYIVLLADYSKLKTVKVQQLEYISKKLDKAIDKFNKKLLKHDFYLEDLKKMSAGFKINFNDKNMVLQLHEEIRSELKESCDFFNQFPKGFTHMEDQVHELRRKIRWISIYAASFQGLIALNEPKENYKWEKEFITKEEAKNPFNKLPIKKNLNQYILFNKKAFYAMSFVIGNLGEIKDNCIRLQYLEKASKKTTIEKGTDHALLAQKQLNVKYSHDALLKEAHILLKLYFNKYKIHEILT
ncbi:MAG: hypothetical protein ABIP51_15885 [Bacteroidia bacterium]